MNIQPNILIPPQTTTVSLSKDAATFFQRIAGRDGTAFRQFPPKNLTKTAYRSFPCSSIINNNRLNTICRLFKIKRFFVHNKQKPKGVARMLSLCLIAQRSIRFRKWHFINSIVVDPKFWVKLYQNLILYNIVSVISNTDTSRIFSKNLKTLFSLVFRKTWLSVKNNCWENKLTQILLKYFENFSHILNKCSIFWNAYDHSIFLNGRDRLDMVVELRVMYLRKILQNLFETL